MPYQSSDSGSYLKRVLTDSLYGSPDTYPARVDSVATYSGLPYYASNSSRVINWRIENMPEGKQTIIVL
jgi:hypothetical protein